MENEGIKEMYNLFAEKIPDNAHNRRIMYHLKELAEECYDQEIVSLPYTRFRMFMENGNRTEYEAYYFEHRRLYAIYALMTLWETDERWLSKLCDCIWAICDEYTWVLPAHTKTCTETEANVTQIDLFAGETGMALAEMWYILGNRLPEMVKNRIIYELDRRIIQPYMKTTPRWGINNWSAVCGGTVGSVFIYLGKDKEFQAVKGNLQQNMQDFLDSFTEDGCCLEGGLYWNYGFSFFCYFTELLRQYSDGKIDYFANDKVKKIAYFGQNTLLQDDKMISFSDSPHVSRYNCGLWHLLKRKYEGINLPDEKWESWFGDGYGDSKRYRFAQLIRNLFWYTEDKEQPVIKTQDYVYYENGAWYINKKHAYRFAAKAGHNAEPHNHNDVGSFILFDHGKYILDDVGWSEYDNTYFTEKRYENMCASSLGHSVPIAGGPQKEGGSEHAGEVIEVTEDTFAIEMTKPYQNRELRSLIRRFTLSDDEIRIVDIPKGEIDNYVERFVTRIVPRIEGDRVVIDEYELFCTGESSIELSSFDFEPRFESFNKEDPFETAYLIDFVPDKPQKMEIIVRKRTEGTKNK